jgi:hypothetical protein
LLCRLFRPPLLSNHYLIFEREDIAKSLENCVPDGNDFRPQPQSILDYRPNSDSAKEFETLASEVLKKIGLEV